MELRARLLSFLLMLQTVSSLSVSDFYFVDPQTRQSVPVETESETEDVNSEGVEDQILQLLGLPNSPRPSYKHLNKNAGPQFMMHLYQEIQKQEGLDDIIPTPAPLIEQVGPELKNLSYEVDQNVMIEDTDIVISFDNEVSKNRLGMEHEDDTRYFFELDDVTESMELNNAELRLFKTASSHSDGYYFITAFKIDEPSGIRERKFDASVLDTLSVNSSYEGWLVFNVTVAMETWKADQTTNRGLFIQVHTITGDEVLPHRMGIVNRHGESEKQGFMVAFFKSLEPLNKKIPLITQPSVRRKKRSMAANGYWDSPDSHRYSRKLCQRKHLYVKFKRLNFESWIIAPDGYPAFYCEGECSFPLSSHMNATNHAIVQTLVSLIQPRKFPKACCAPRKLSSTSILYYDEKSKVVLKKYRNMVVQSCGCH